MRNSFNRKVLLTLSAAGAIAGLTHSASATLLLYEPFDYTAGASLGGSGGVPVGQTNANTGGGTWHARGTGGPASHNPAQDVTVSAGNLSYTGLAPSLGNSVSYGSATGYANSIDIPGADVTGGSLYASFIIRLKGGLAAGTRYSPASMVTDATPPGTLGSDLAGQSGTAVAQPGGFWVRTDPVQATTSNFSPSKSSGDGIGPAATGPSAGWQHSAGGTNVEANQFGDTDGQTHADSVNTQTYFVVLKYQFDAMATTNSQNDTVSLWMNPGSGTLASPTGEADASQAPTGNLGSYYAAIGAFGTGALDVAAIRSFALIAHRQNTTNTIPVDFDELRIGTTWESVTPVPEPVGLAMLAVAGAGLLKRRRAAV